MRRHLLDSFYPNLASQQFLHQAAFLFLKNQVPGSDDKHAVRVAPPGGPWPQTSRAHRPTATWPAPVWRGPRGFLAPEPSRQRGAGVVIDLNTDALKGVPAWLSPP